MAYESIDKMNYYQLLGVTLDARGDVIKRAFHAFAQTYHPDRHVAQPPDVRERIHLVYRRGAEAYRVLSAPQTRKAYNDALASGQKRLDTSASKKVKRTGVASIKNRRARPFARKADAAAKSAEWKTAKFNAKLALQHEPDNEWLKSIVELADSNLNG